VAAAAPICFRIPKARAYNSGRARINYYIKRRTKSKAGRAAGQKSPRKGGRRMTGNMWPALLMSSLAGLATSIGGFIGVFGKKNNEKFLSAALGFSAGVMLLISFGELLPDAKSSLLPALGATAGGLAAAGALAGGAAAAMLISFAVPDEAPGSAGKPPCKADSGAPVRDKLVRVGLVTALAVTVHNLPEGIATFMAGYADIRLGLPVAISIALHNIPEGIAVAVPVYYGSGSRAKGVAWSALSGLSEPLGALLAFMLLAPFMSAVTLGIIFAAVAGIMIFISFDGLIPSSQLYGHTGCAIGGAAAGIVFMKLAMTIFGL
jgi:ZIP family zinc transporter